MQLAELLTELRTNILHDSSGIVDGPEDTLWSDDTLIRYLNEAQKKFCMDVGGILDNETASVTKITLATDVTEYTLHSSILAVLSARIAGQPVDLIRVGHGLTDTRYPIPITDDLMFTDPMPYEYYTNHSPTWFSTDEGPTMIRLGPAVTSDWNGVIMNLRVMRLPLTTFVATDKGALPEIRDEHHMDILQYAAYLAFNGDDADSSSRQRAKDRLGMYQDAIKRAKRGLRRRHFRRTAWHFTWNWRK